VLVVDEASGRSCCRSAVPSDGQPVAGAVRVPRPHRAAGGADRGARRDGEVSWRTEWTLTWEPTDGAQEYAVSFGTNEGAGGQPRRSLDEPELRLTAAAGTSSPDRLDVDREAGLLFTSSQLLVSVAARTADGADGPRSPWFPVGDVPADGRPVGTAVGGHEEGHGA
jgi:hypothetical protein